MRKIQMGLLVLGSLAVACAGGSGGGPSTPVVIPPNCPGTGTMVFDGLTIQFEIAAQVDTTQSPGTGTKVEMVERCGFPGLPSGWIVEIWWDVPCNPGPMDTTDPCTLIIFATSPAGDEFLADYSGAGYGTLTILQYGGPCGGTTIGDFSGSLENLADRSDIRSVSGSFEAPCG